jgi:hypothetical protein
VVGEGNEARGGPRQVGGDGADARMKLARCHSTLAQEPAWWLKPE